MKPFKSVAAILAVAVPLALAAPAQAMAPSVQTAAAEFLKAIHDQVIEAFASGTPSDQRLPLFEAIVARNIDIDRFTRRVAGEALDDMSVSQRTAFSQAVVEHVSRKFAKVLNSAFIESFKVLNVSTGGDDDEVHIKSQVEQRFSLRSPKHQWVLTVRDDGAFRIADVMEAGFSFAKMQEKKLRGMLDDHGVDGMIAELKETD